MYRIILIFVMMVLLPVKLFSQKCIQGNCNNGKGKWQFVGGNVVEADFKDGLYTSGILITPDGDRYEGSFKKEYFDGLGYFKKKNGDFQIGVFKKDTLYSGYEYKNKIIIQKIPKISGSEVSKIGQGLSQIKKEEQSLISTLSDNDLQEKEETIVESLRIMNPNENGGYTHFLYTGKLLKGFPNDENGIGVYFSEINELYTYKGNYKTGKRNGEGEIINSGFTLNQQKKNKQKVVKKYKAFFTNDIELIK